MDASILTAMDTSLLTSGGTSILAAMNSHTETKDEKFTFITLIEKILTARFAFVPANIFETRTCATITVMLV